MRTIALLLVASLALSLAAPMASAKAAPQFFETTVVEDVEGDYSGDQALDIVGVYIAEKYTYDADKQMGHDTVSFRIHVTNLADIKCGATYRYDVAFKVDGAAKSQFVTFTTEPPTNTNSGCSRKVGEASSPSSLRTNLNSILISVPRETLGAPVGSVLSGFIAWSSVVTPVQTVAQDQAPQDNANAPSSTAPTTGLKSYTMLGTYPFITVVPTAPTEQYSIGGGEVEYEFELFSHPDLKDDNIRVRFTYPSGWSISPSQGRTGSDPEGQLTGGNGGVPRQFGFTLSSSGAAAEGDQVSVIMEVITENGGHVLVPTVTTVSGTKIVNESVTFQLLTPGPFKAEEINQVQFSAADAAGPLQGVVLSVDLIKDGRRISTTPLTGGPNGIHQAGVRFPSEGTYLLDAYISSLAPSPHQEFAVKAEKGGLAPPMPLWMVLLAVVGLVLVRRRST